MAAVVELCAACCSRWKLSRPLLLLLLLLLIHNATKASPSCMFSKNHGQKPLRTQKIFNMRFWIESDTPPSHLKKSFRDLVREVFPKARIVPFWNWSLKVLWNHHSIWFQTIRVKVFSFLLISSIFNVTQSKPSDFKSAAQLQFGITNRIFISAVSAVC